jgi:Uma2 family endonuclease
MTIALAPRPKVKLRVEDFDLLAESGGLAGLERTELLDGDIYLMSPQYTRHALAKSVFYDAVRDWTVANAIDLRTLMEVSVAMPPNDEPIPDVVLTSEWKGRLGVPVSSVALLVEIADSSLRDDLDYKGPLYARQGVPEYWVVDLAGRKVLRHAEPGTDGYARIEEIAFGQPVKALTLDALTVETHDLLIEM